MSAMIIAPSTESLENFILSIRGQNVILDVDLAGLYGVTTKRLNEQVKRNRERFPDDFMFRLSDNEKQKVVAVCDHLKNIKYSHANPNAFTEYGVIMAATVLNSPAAIEMSVLVVRAFVKLRALLTTHADLRNKFQELEAKILSHDKTLKSLVIAIKRLIDTPQPASKRRIGFESWVDNKT